MLEFHSWLGCTLKGVLPVYAAAAAVAVVIVVLVVAVEVVVAVCDDVFDVDVVVYDVF